MKISQSCYAVTGLSCEPPWTVNAGFVTGEGRTLVIDTGSNRLSAQTSFGYATCARPENTLLVINTEQHLDHLSGNAFFHEQGCEIYGHYRIARKPEDLAANIADYAACIVNPARRERGEAAIFYGYTELVNPTRPIHEEFSLDLGNLEAQIIFTPGHTPSNISVYLPAEGVLYCGDCLVSDYLPNLEQGDPAAWQTWLASLDKIEALAPRLIMPGHGIVLEGKKLAEEIARTRRILEEAIEAGIAPTIFPGTTL